MAIPAGDEISVRCISSGSCVSSSNACSFRLSKTPRRRGETAFANSAFLREAVSQVVIPDEFACNPNSYISERQPFDCGYLAGTRCSLRSYPRHPHGIRTVRLQRDRLRKVGISLGLVVHCGHTQDTRTQSTPLHHWELASEKWTSQWHSLFVTVIPKTPAYSRARIIIERAQDTLKRLERIGSGKHHKDTKYDG